jgi:gliding motility-associated-like protein
VEVNIFGEIISNRHNFIKEVTLTDDCSGAAIFYNMPKAVDDCSKTPSVILYNGLSSGSTFARGSTALVFEAKDEKGNLTQCQVEVKVSEPARLIETDKDTLIVCKDNDLILSGLPIKNAKYEWQGPNNFTSKLLQTTVSKVQLASGTYQFKSTIGKCTFDDSIHVTYLSTPIAHHDFYELQPGEIINKSILLNDTFLKNIPFQISLKSGVTQGDLAFNNDGTFKYTAPANVTGNETFTYELCQNDCPNNCAQAVANIKVQFQGRIGVKATNVITPNGDDINDYLTIVGFDHTKPDNKSEMCIFNQWGDLVHRAAPYKNDWNGNFKNNPLPDGTYYFIFYSAPDAEPIKDFVTIMR